MEKNSFEMLVDVLRIMDTEAMKRSNLKHSIKEVLKHFNKSLSQDQKNKVFWEVRNYNEKKMDREETKRIISKLEEARYKEMLETFFEDDMEGW